MAYCDDLLKTARKLAGKPNQKTRSSDANRAVSTAYYAVFDCIAAIVADRVAGKRIGNQTNTSAWVKIYRSLDHRAVRDAILRAVQQGEMLDYDNLQKTAVMFQRLQSARESADYDPLLQFTSEQARALIAEAEFAISAFKSSAPAALGPMVAEIILRNKQRLST
jgi:uncharacterized protein (UPF0332 family)